MPSASRLEGGGSGVQHGLAMAHCADRVPLAAHLEVNGAGVQSKAGDLHSRFSRTAVSAVERVELARQMLPVMASRGSEVLKHLQSLGFLAACSDEVPGNCQMIGKL